MSVSLSLVHLFILMQAELTALAMPASTQWWQYCLALVALALANALSGAIKDYFHEKAKEQARTEDEKLEDAIRLIEKGERLKQLLRNTQTE